MTANIEMVNIYNINRLLSKRYNNHLHYNKRGPIAEIVFILLSTRTEEYNYLRTYRSLREKYPSWNMLLTAPEHEIENAIKLGGLSKIKARQIKNVLTSIKNKTGALSLKHLKVLSDDELECFLISLPGVGVKIARCVMMYAFGRKVFPVDTHCLRISQRLQLIDGRIKKRNLTKKSMDEIQKMIPPNLRLSLHVNFISLGRELCIASRPRCAICPLSSMCPTAKKVFVN